MDLSMPAGLRASTPAPSADDLFTAAYERYQGMVRWVILDRLGNGDTALADDLTQDTFLRLFTYRERIDFGPRVPGLLRLMARQSISRHYRVMRNTREVPADTGHWTYANRALAPACGGTLAPTRGNQGDSDPDMDEALKRARAPRALAVTR